MNGKHDTSCLFPFIVRPHSAAEWKRRIAYSTENFHLQNASDETEAITDHDVLEAAVE